MNVYIFTIIGKRISSYPEDTLSEVFDRCKNLSNFYRQIIAHRLDNHILYTYLRKIDENSFFGLSVVLDGAIDDLRILWQSFEGCVTDFLNDGVLLSYTQSSGIVWTERGILESQEEVNLKRHNLEILLKKRTKGHLRQIPPVDFSVSIDSIKQHSISDAIEDIIYSCHTFGYTVIVPESNEDAIRPNRYQTLIKKISDENSSLKEKNKKLLAKKKQLKIVSILAVVLLFAVVGIYFLTDNLKSTKNALSNANDTIGFQRNDISQKSMRISNLQISNENLQSELRTEYDKRIEAENKLYEISDNIRRRQPFVITKTSFNFSTGYFSFDYYGMEEKYVRFVVCAFSEDGEYFYNNNYALYVYKGHHSHSVYFSSDLNGGKYYSFLIKERDDLNVIIGGGRH